MKRKSHREIYHTSGLYINEKKLQLPFRITMYAGKESGYDQYDPDFKGEVELLTFEKRLIDYYSEF